MLSKRAARTGPTIMHKPPRASVRKRLALREAARGQAAADKLVREAAIAAGQCPCETEAEDPGPHLPSCPWNDPDYPRSGQW